MKKTISLLLALCLMLAMFAGCGTQTTTPADPGTSDVTEPAGTPDAQPDEQPEEPEPPAEPEAPVEEPADEPVVVTEPVDFNIAVLKGSTGMGMAKLMADAQAGEAANNYQFTLTSDTADVMAKVISGEYDIAALPTNSAAMAYAKTQGEVQLLAINTLGVLYLLQKTGVDGSPIQSFEELRGKTIVSMGQGANPEYVLSYLLSKNGLTIGEDVTVDWKATADEVLSAVVTGDYDFVMLPEPNVSVAMTDRKSTRLNSSHLKLSRMPSSA